jgi:hypothetical protein
MAQLGFKDRLEDGPKQDYVTAVQQLLESDQPNDA